MSVVSNVVFVKLFVLVVHLNDSYCTTLVNVNSVFLACCARSLQRIATLYCRDVRPSVYLRRACILIADLSLWLDSPMFWATLTAKHMHTLSPSRLLPVPCTWKRGAVWMCKLGVISQQQLKIEVTLLLSANRKSHIRLRRLAQQPCVTLNGCFSDRALSL